jgi:ABC-type multidrug transport system fused ATPase/permease subunit
MIDIYRKVLSLLDERAKRRFLLLLFIFLVVSSAEIVSLSSVLFLISILAEPEGYLDNFWVAAAFGDEIINDLFKFQISLSVLTTIIIFCGLCIKTLGRYAIFRFSASFGASIANNMLNHYFVFSYEWYIVRNSAEIKTAVLDQAQRVSQQIILPSLTLFSNIVISITIMGFLVVVEPLITITSAFLIGGIYVLIFRIMKFRLRSLGQQITADNMLRHRVMGEASEGLKELKLLGLEPIYSRRFAKPTWRLARNNAQLNTIGELPRYALEGVAFAVMLGVMLFLMARYDGSLVAALPTIGAFAFAAMRLLPILQQMYFSFVSIRTGLPALENLHKDYLSACERASRAPVPHPRGSRLPFLRELEIDMLHYAYPNAPRAALNGVSIRIPARATIGLVGGTGAGKTTLVDVILGLLEPTSGEIRVDGQGIDRDNVKIWQQNIGYVPQVIYLSDATLAQNIAFGIEANEIDRTRVETVGRMAALHDFVVNDLPEGYDTFVGERGVRLSGGQRQRIGIARALYHDPAMLIFDEATSALDTLTEKAVVAAIQNIRQNKTVILIAHRLSTVRNCDAIYLLENGKITASGTYEKLRETNEVFQQMTALD